MSYEMPTNNWIKSCTVLWALEKWPAKQNQEKAKWKTYFASNFNHKQTKVYDSSVVTRSTRLLGQQDTQSVWAGSVLKWKAKKCFKFHQEQCLHSCLTGTVKRAQNQSVTLLTGQSLLKLYICCQMTNCELYTLPERVSLVKLAINQWCVPYVTRCPLSEANCLPKHIKLHWHTPRMKVIL